MTAKVQDLVRASASSCTNSSRPTIASGVICATLDDETDPVNIMGKRGRYRQLSPLRGSTLLSVNGTTGEARKGMCSRVAQKRLQTRYRSAADKFRTCMPVPCFRIFPDFAHYVTGNATNARPNTCPVTRISEQLAERQCSWESQPRATPASRSACNPRHGGCGDQQAVRYYLVQVLRKQFSVPTV